MLQTETIEWSQFKERFAFLMGEMAPALRGVDDETIAFRTGEWAVLPRWDAGEFIFEYYAEEPDTFRPGDDETQILVTNVPWGNF